jgi:dTDP-4-amino-4,6-dideoxygalactose transaminase
MTVVPFVDLSAQYRSIKPEIDTAIGEVLATCSFILGKQMVEFEEAFAEFVNVKHAIGVSSGLDALRLALMALDIGYGDEVILPANTYIATALAVSGVGAKPVLVDCEPTTYNIDVASIESKISRATRAIIPVHLTGQSADMDAVLEVADRHKLWVIEDAAQAHGALYSYGDGGMVVTNDSKLAERIRRVRNYGERAKYEHVEKGLNAILDTLQAAVLGLKLRYLPEWNAARARHADRYAELLTGVGDLVLQKRAPYSTHVYHLYIIETDERDALREHLSAAGIQTGIHYPKPIHLQEAYVDLGCHEGDFPQTERLAGRILSLPMFPELSEEQIDRVAVEVRKFFVNGLVRSDSDRSVPKYA